MMQRYRPSLGYPVSGDPFPMMAEDSAEGQYYDKDEVDRTIQALESALAQARLNAQTPLENYIGSLGLQDQPEGKHS